MQFDFEFHRTVLSCISRQNSILQEVCELLEELSHGELETYLNGPLAEMGQKYHAHEENR